MDLRGSTVWRGGRRGNAGASTRRGSSRRRSVDLVRRSAAGPDRRRRRRGPRRWAHVRGAREARDVHRHRDRSRTNERRPGLRDREPAARRRSRTRRARRAPDLRRPRLVRDHRGSDRGDLLDPIRGTRIHPWHDEHGAVFEDVGQWKRPRYFPREDEDMEAAVARECRAVRNAAGVLDASTLGKIEVVGPDAAAFLDRMYTNRMSTLAVGSIRYGFMLGLDGMVADDGVAMRLAEDRFLSRRPPGTPRWSSTASRSGSRPSGRICASTARASPSSGPTSRSRSEGARRPRRARHRHRPLDRGLPFMTFRDGTVAASRRGSPA